MRKQKWIVLLVGLLACGLIAAGCGDDDSSDSSSTAATSATTSEDTSPTTSEDTSTESTTSEATSTAEDSTSSDTSGGTSPDDIYNACIDLVEGTVAEDSAKAYCQQARDVFQECIDAAQGSSTKLKVCQGAADKALKSLQAAG